MNILMVTMQMHIGGAETHILELCRELHRRGHHVTLVSNGGVYADMLAAEGIEQVILPFHTKTPAAVVKAMRGLEQCIRAGNRWGDYEILHAHARIPAWISGLLWDRFRKHPIIREGRQVPLFRFVTTAHLNFSINPLWRRISRWGEMTMSVSDDIVEYLVEEYGCVRERIRTTINGIDMEKFSPEADFRPVLREFGLPEGEDRLRLVYMSRLDADRAAYGYSIARLAPRLARAFPQLDILIVGGGTEEAQIRAIAEEANRTAGRNVVTVTGGRSDTHLFCAAADVFVGVSRSALEAMAAAKPVIVAGNQGVLGVLTPEKLRGAMETNFCCRGCGDCTDDGLFGEIEALLRTDKARRAEMGQWCRSVIRQYYTASRMAGDYEELYKAALAAPVAFDGPGDVMLSGYYGFGNMGDESLLSVIAASMAETCPGIRITALTRHPKGDGTRTGLRCISRTDLWRIWREMGRTKLFVSGGGSLLQDVTSGKSLRYYAALLTMAKKRGMQTYMYANGIGPIQRESNRMLAGRVAGGCDAVSVRDPDSREELLRLGVEENRIWLSADPAYLLSCPDSETCRRTMDRYGLGDLARGSYAVLSLRRLNRSRDTDPAMIGELGALCRELVNMGLTPVFVPMQPQNDRAVCEAAAAAAGASARIAEPASAREMLAIVSGARLAIAMRLHCLIYASAAAVPVMGLSYDPKIDALMKCLEQPYVYRAETVRAGELTEGVRDILAKEEEIRRTLSRASGQMREKCREDLARVRQMMYGK